MSDLRDAFKKAGLISDKDDKRLRHEDRVRKKQLGREGLEEEQKRREREAAERARQEKEKVRTAQKALNQDKDQRSREKVVLARLKDEVVRQVQGPKRFHYRDPDGYLPFLNLNDDAVRRLEAGEYALVQRPDSSEVVVVQRDLAEELRQVRGESIRHWAGQR